MHTNMMQEVSYIPDVDLLCHLIRSLSVNVVGKGVNVPKSVSVVPGKFENLQGHQMLTFAN